MINILNVSYKSNQLLTESKFDRVIITKCKLVRFNSSNTPHNNEYIGINIWIFLYEIVNKQLRERERGRDVKSLKFESNIERYILSFMIDWLIDWLGVINLISNEIFLFLSLSLELMYIKWRIDAKPTINFSSNY